MVIFKWKRVTGYEGIKECKKKASSTNFLLHEAQYFFKHTAFNKVKLNQEIITLTKNINTT
jgi:uncharacterized protein (DUF2344 family)